MSVCVCACVHACVCACVCVCVHVCVCACMRVCACMCVTWVWYELKFTMIPAIHHEDWKVHEHCMCTHESTIRTVCILY